MTKNLLKLRGFKFTIKDFFLAIRTEDPAIINGFMDAGMDPNSKNQAGMTALTFAIINSDLRTIRVLARRADINLKDDQGNAPLHLSILLKNEAAIDFLLGLKANVNITGKDRRVTNQSPLYASYLQGNSKLLVKLLNSGADPNIADSNGAFPLSEACIRRGATIDTLKLLINKGADINKVENNGASALTYAAQNSGIDAETRTAMVKLLIENGADKSLKDNTGKTALDWAKEIGHTELVEILDTQESEAK